MLGAYPVYGRYVSSNNQGPILGFPIKSAIIEWFKNFMPYVGPARASRNYGIIYGDVWTLQIGSDIVRCQAFAVPLPH